MKFVPPMTTTDRRRRRRDRVLRSVQVLPSLATLGNLVCGLGAIYFCILSAQAGGADLAARAASSAKFASIFPTYLAMGAYLLVAAMFFDGIDGRLARFTRKTSEFGGQLDSLADMVSFGVAPAVLVLCIVRPHDVVTITGLPRVYWRAEWVMAAVYVCCAALRLARFNVENVEDESAHLGFRGLPSPGAAAAVVGLVVFHQDLLPDLTRGRTLAVVAAFMPPFIMVLGLLMVSRFQYLHLINSVLRGRRPFRQVVVIFITFLVGLVVQFQLTVALAACLYALSGPVGWAILKTRRAASSSAGPLGQAALPADAPFDVADPAHEDDGPSRNAL